MELLKINIFHKTLFLTLLLFLFFFKQGLSQFHYQSSYCLDTGGNYTDGSTYKNNLHLLLPKLTRQASIALFNNYTVGTGIDQAYGLYMCRGDLNDHQCHDCVQTASKTITKNCPAEIEAIVWYQECLVRYTNRSIFNLEEDSPLSYAWSTSNVSNPAQFGKIIDKTMNGLIQEAAYKSSNGYATAEANITLFDTLYTMAQCTPDILGSRCERCLRVALSSMGGCCGTSRVSMAMYFPSCWLRYASSPFVKDISAPPLAPEPSWVPVPSSLPQGKSIATMLTPKGIRSGFWLLMAISIPTITIMAL